MSNLFVIDLYKVLLTIDERAQKIYELNKALFYKVVDQLSILEMNIGRAFIDRSERENILYTPIIKFEETGSSIIFNDNNENIYE